MTQVSPVQTNDMDSLYRTNFTYQGPLPFEYFLNIAQGQLTSFNFNPGLTISEIESDFDGRGESIRLPEYQNENIRESENRKENSASINQRDYQANKSVNKQQLNGSAEIKLNPQLHQEIIQKIFDALPLAFGKLDASLSVFSSNSDKGIVSHLDLNNLIDQIIGQIKLIKDHGKTQLLIGLKPDNLGEILLTVTSLGGIISIQMNTSENTKKVIDANLANLEEALKKAHINLNEIKVEAINYDVHPYSNS